MAIPITCPGCQAAFEVPEALAGKTIRCTSCKTQLTVAAAAPTAESKKPFGWASSPATAAKAEAAPLTLDDEPAAPAAKPAVAKAVPAKPVKAAALVEVEEEKTNPQKAPAKNGPTIKGAPKKRRDDDDDDDDEPRRKPRNKSGGAGPMIGIIGGGLVCLGAIAGLSIWLLSGDEKKDTAKTDTNNTNNQTPGGAPPPGDGTGAAGPVGGDGTGGPGTGGRPGGGRPGGGRPDGGRPDDGGMGPGPGGVPFPGGTGDGGSGGSGPLPGTGGVVEPPATSGMPPATGGGIGGAGPGGGDPPPFIPGGMQPPGMVDPPLPFNPGGGQPPVVPGQPGGAPGQPGGAPGQPGGQPDPNPPPFGAIVDGNLKASLTPFFTGAFDPDKKEFFTFSAKLVSGRIQTTLNRYDVAKSFMGLGSYKVPTFATRAVVDSSKGLMYVATAANPKTLGAQQFDQAAGVGDVAIYDLKPIRDGKTKEGDTLKQLATISIAKKIHGLELTGDGKALVVVTTATSGKTSKSQLHKFDTETRKLIDKPKDLTEPAWNACKSPDGKHLLVIDMVTQVGQASSVRMYDLDTLAAVKALTLQGAALDIAAATSGQFVGVVNGNAGVKLVHANDAVTRDLEIGAGWKAAHKPGYADFSPDGKQLFVSGHQSQGFDVYDVVDIDSPTGVKKKSSIRTANGTMVGGHFFVSPEGEYIVFHTGVVLDSAKIGGYTGDGVGGGAPGFPGGAPGIPGGGPVIPGGGPMPGGPAIPGGPGRPGVGGPGGDGPVPGGPAIPGGGPGRPGVGGPGGGGPVPGGPAFPGGPGGGPGRPGVGGPGGPAFPGGPGGGPIVPVPVGPGGAGPGPGGAPTPPGPPVRPGGN